MPSDGGRRPHPLRWLTRLWRSSLQRRVVISTVAAGLLAVSGVGAYLYQQLADGLKSDRVRIAQQEARSLAKTAKDDFDNNDTQSLVDLNSFARAQIQSLVPPPPEASRFVALMPALTNRSPGRLTSVFAGGLITSPVPLALRQAVDKDPSHQSTMVIELDRSALLAESAADSSGLTTIAAVVVGTQLDVRSAGPHEIFFIYPMDREENTLALIRRVFLVGLLALLTFLAGISWLATRQVVRPVERAADVAERLAAGNLNERMPSTGDDELAVLGRSFNDMADHLQSQIRQLEDLSQVQQIFVSDVSHELRTPLTTIRMAADVIHDRRADFTPDLARSAELLSTELDRFENLLADLLEISRFDARAADLEADPVDVAGVVRRSIQAVETLAQAKGSRIRLQAPRAEVIAEVDVRRVERILRNLLVNAVEHGEGLPVTVTVAGNRSAVAVSVRDHGVGLRPGESALVFNRFWRADPARARTTGGTGLGLAISLEDARLHNGWLEAWGRPGEGSVFRLTLPRTVGEPIESSPLHLLPAAERIAEAAEEPDATTKLRPHRRERSQA
ncbi:MAG: MtrAB system histidine kinase MtrB [Dermatophilaceae bacterium]